MGSGCYKNFYKNFDPRLCINSRLDSDDILLLLVHRVDCGMISTFEAALFGL